MRMVLACIGLVIVLCRDGMAQCPTPSQLTDTYRAVLLRPFDDQLEPLLALRRQWEECRQPFDSIYVGTLLQLGQGYHAQGNLGKAVAVVRRAITVCRTNHNRTRIADLTKAWYRLGVLHVYQNQMQAATAALEKAIEIGVTDSKVADWVGDAHLYLAYTYITLGDCQQTILHADAGIPFAQRIGDKGLMSNLLRQKAQAFFILGDYINAQPAILAAIDNIRDEKTYQEALADSYDLLSLILAGQEQYQEAVRYAERSYAIAEKTKYTQLPNFANELSFLYSKVGNYSKAIQYGQYGIDHAVDAFGKAASYNILGVTYWRQRQFDKALSYYQQGLRTLPIGFRGQTTAANPDEEQLRLVAHKGILLTLMQDKADTWLDYAKATGSRQRLQHALATYRVADQMIDFMRWEHTGQQSKLFWRQKTRGMYERAIESCYRLGDAEQAFRFMEKSRAVMLADQLNELGARQQLAPAQVTQEQQLRQAVTDQQATLAGLTPDSSAYAPARSGLLNRQDRLGAFLKRLEASNPAYYRYKYDNITPSLADLKAYLKPKQAQFVSYFVGDSALYVLAVAAGRDTLIRQSLGAYKQTVRQFMDLLANPDAMNQTANVQQFLRLGNSLYRQLLAPLQLRGGRVVVSPDGAFVPFEALSQSATKPDYLVMTHAFSYAYSAGLLIKTHPVNRTNLKQTDFLGVAPVSFAPALGQVSLPGSDRAVRAIAPQFGSAVLLTNAQATRRAFLTEAAHARVVHLFTHGTATDSTDAEPRLYFADSTLKLSELGTDGLLTTQLVVLAACKTGVGSYQRGEGVFSMARGFAALGVPSVLTTLWSVDNKATYTITDLFEQNLARGLPKDEALQQAQRDWLAAADGVGQLPTYWAGLIIVGNAEPLAQVNSWPWLAAGLGGLVVGGALLWRRKRRSMSTVSSLRPV